MNNAFGIITAAGNHISVKGLQNYTSIGSFSFLGRYRVIDFPISNMSNSDIDQIQVYVGRNPRSLADHLGSGREFNINSKRGKLQLLFSENNTENDIYNTDIAAYMENMGCIEEMNAEYVVIAPSYMVYSMNFNELLKTHIDSGADITLLYHAVDNARTCFLDCNLLNLNRQKGVMSIERNCGNAKNRNIFMDTYVMKKDMFIDLIYKAKILSSMYTFPQIVNIACSDLDIRGVAHHGYFASITDFRSYYDANMALIDFKKAGTLFDSDWPIYTRTNDSCPTHYFDSSSVKSSVVANGCIVEGSIENSIIGRGCVIGKGAVVRNSILLAGSFIGDGVLVENQVVDKRAKVIREKKVIAPADNPGYIRRNDTI